MSKVLLIFRHEFGLTAKRVGFIIMTLTPPVVALLGIGISNVAAGHAQPTAQTITIGYVDQAGGFQVLSDTGNIVFTHFDSVDEATQAAVSGDVAEFFVIPVDFMTSGVVQRYTLHNEVTAPDATATAIQDFITSNLLSGYVSSDIISRVETPLTLVTTMLTSTGGVAARQGGTVNIIIPFVFSLLLALSLGLSSSYVLQSLGEEKENRLMEILLSSVSTRQLVTGKLLGIGTAGLLQVLVWVISAPLLLGLASSSIGGILSTIQIPVHFFVFGVIYFVLGYGVFAVFSAGVAAISPSVRDAQGFASMFSIFAVAPLWFYSLLFLYPDSPVWFVFSVFPFSAPVVVMLRLGLTGVPALQLVVSIAVLVLSVIGGVLVASRLLRAYLLMYGKRPKIREMVRSLRGG